MEQVIEECTTKLCEFIDISHKDTLKTFLFEKCNEFLKNKKQKVNDNNLGRKISHFKGYYI